MPLILDGEVVVPKLQVVRGAAVELAAPDGARYPAYPVREVGEHSSTNVDARWVVPQEARDGLVKLANGSDEDVLRFVERFGVLSPARWAYPADAFVPLSADAMEFRRSEWAQATSSRLYPPFVVPEIYRRAAAGIVAVRHLSRGFRQWRPESGEAWIAAVRGDAKLCNAISQIARVVGVGSDRRLLEVREGDTRSAVLSMQLLIHDEIERWPVHVSRSEAPSALEDLLAPVSQASRGPLIRVREYLAPTPCPDTDGVELSVIQVAMAPAVRRFMRADGTDSRAMRVKRVCSKCGHGFQVEVRVGGRRGRPRTQCDGCSNAAAMRASRERKSRPSSGAARGR